MGKKVIGERSLVDIVVNRTKKIVPGYSFKLGDEQIIINLAFKSVNPGYLSELQRVHGTELNDTSCEVITGDYNNAIKCLCNLFRNHILGISKPVKEEKTPKSSSEMMYDFVIRKIKEKYPKFPYLDQITPEYVLNVIKENNSIFKITPSFFERIARIIVKRYNNPSTIDNSTADFEIISLDELKKIFNGVNLYAKGDAEVIYNVIKLNGMWNNQDFKDKLGMSIDEVRDRVLKILSSHIQTECNHPQIHMIYKICLNFLHERKVSYVKERVK